MDRAWKIKIIERDNLQSGIFFVSFDSVKRWQEEREGMILGQVHDNKTLTCEVIHKSRLEFHILPVLPGNLKTNK